MASTEGTKARIERFLLENKISKNQFYKNTGLSNGFLTKGSSVTSDKLKIIVEAYPSISLEWLVMGNSSPLSERIKSIENEIDTIKAQLNRIQKSLK